MPQFSPYLEYLNRLNTSQYSIQTLQQLSDGLYMHEIVSSLKEFESSYPYEIIPEPLTFVHRMKNIKSLIKAIHSFWSNHVRQQVCYQIDAIKVAKDKSVKEIQKLIRLLVKTLFQAKDKHYFIEIVLQTSQQTQQFFMDLVKQETSIEFTSPKSSKSVKNYSDSVYDKLLELEHENEHLLSLVEELASMNYDNGQKQKDLQEKINEKDAEIRRLNWALNQVSEKNYKPEESDLSGSRERILEELVSERVKQVEEREKVLMSELQKLRYLYKCQSEELETVKSSNAQVNTLKQENLNLKVQLQFQEHQLTELKQKLEAYEDQARSILEESLEKTTQISTYKSQLTHLSMELSSKAQQIYQLETNIRFLTEEKEELMFRQTGSSIKDDCREVNPPVIVRKKRETDKVNKELRSALLTVTKQEKQIQRLRLYEEENKKLTQIISHMQSYRGQENQVLVHCLYKLRTKLLDKENGPQFQEKSLNSKTTGAEKPERSPLGEISLNQ